jgi:hypothetical protein
MASSSGYKRRDNENQIKTCTPSFKKVKGSVRKWTKKDVVVGNLTVSKWSLIDPSKKSRFMEQEWTPSSVYANLLRHQKSTRQYREWDGELEDDPVAKVRFAFRYCMYR